MDCSLPVPLSMGFPRQEYWSELPFPSPGDLPDPGIKSSLLHWQAGSLPPSHPGNPFVWTSLVIVYVLSWNVPVEDSRHLQCLVFRSAGLFLLELWVEIQIHRLWETNESCHQCQQQKPGVHPTQIMDICIPNCHPFGLCQWNSNAKRVWEL